MVGAKPTTSELLDSDRDPRHTANRADSRDHSKNLDSTAIKVDSFTPDLIPNLVVCCLNRSTALAHTPEPAVRHREAKDYAR